MFPCPRSQARPIVELLLLVAILHGKAHATARLGREEHILATAVAEVEEASHRGSRIGPIDPHGDGHRVHVGNLVGQLHEVAGAIEVERLAARDVLVEIGGRGGADGIETIGRGVSQGVIKLPLSHQTPFAGRLGLNDCRAVRLIFRTVDGFHLILIGHSLSARVVDILTGRHFSGDGVPLLRALLGTQHHVACQIFLSISSPAQADGGIGSLGRESFGSGRCFEFTSCIERQQAPHLQLALGIGRSLGSLSNIGTVGHRLLQQFQTKSRLAVADEVTAPSGILQIPLLVGRATSIVADDVGRRGGVVQHVHVAVVLHVGHLVEAVVAADARINLADVPLLGLGVAPFHLADVGMAVGSAVDSHHAARGEVHNFVDSGFNGRRRHILAIAYVDDAFGVGLTFLIARATGNLHVVGTQRAVAVEIDFPIKREEGERRGVGLTLRGTDEGFHVLRLVVAIDRCRRPLGAVLTVADARAVVADVAELTAGTAVEAPPHAGLHAVLGTHHSFAHVVQLVGITIVAVGRHLREEFGIGIEGACQLMGTTPVYIGLHGIIPRQGLIAVQRVARRDEESGIFLLQLSRYLFHVGLAALLPVGVVGLVEGRHTYHAMLRVVFVDIVDVSTDHGNPMVHIRIAGGAIPAFVDACLLVGVQDDVYGIAHDIGGLHTFTEHIGLIAGQRCVARQFFAIAETATHQRQVLATDVVDTLAHVLVVAPCHVHAPTHGQLHALIADAERHDDIAVGQRGEILARRRPLGLGHCCGGKKQTCHHQKFRFHFQSIF